MSLFNQPSELVHKVDPSLTYCDTLGEGSYGVVYLVSAMGEFYALKVSKCNVECFPVGREFHILQKLESVEGVPKAVHFYPRALRDRAAGSEPLDCYLMQYVQGKNVIGGGYPGVEFFRGLRDIGNNIADMGYTLPADLSCNVLVDTANSPWVIDFMLSKCLSINKARALNKKLVGELEDLMVVMRYKDKNDMKEDIIFQKFLEGAL